MPLKIAWKSELSYKKKHDFSPVSNYLRPSNSSRHLIFNINAVDNLLRFMKIVKYLPEFEHFHCILEN